MEYSKVHYHIHLQVLFHHYLDDHKTNQLFELKY